MQTADKIQVALLCVQIIVAAVQVITTLYFIRSVGITQKQEKDAKDQILLAQRQMDLMARQYQESLRPLIEVTHKQNGSNLCEIELRNEGPGPALSIECDPRISLRGNVIGSKSAVSAYVALPTRGSSPSLHRRFFTLTYKSLDGHDFSTCFFQQHEQFVVVDHRHLRSDYDRQLLQEFRADFIANFPLME
jgi:hypothetical protein